MAIEMASDPDIESALVMDLDGNVIAHSNITDVGKNYLTEGNTFEKELAKKLNMATEGQFDMNDNGKDLLIFCDGIGDSWNMVFILNEDEAFASLWVIYLALGIALAVVIMIIMAVFLHISRQHRQSVKLSNEMMAMADIFETAVHINLPGGNMEIIRGNDELYKLLSGDYTDFSGRCQFFAKTISSERSQDLLTKFMDFSTLIGRLSETDSISQEFMDKSGKWIRLRFIVAERDDRGNVTGIIWANESIDEDRKQQEALRKLSETDLMTGIKNRGSGEAMIRQNIAEGKCGMFILLDADDFKSVNDNFGHKVGDKVIIAIAESLKKAFRETDVVFRLGGDEFAVFSEGITDRDIGLTVINRFFHELSVAPLEELRGRKITVSVGVSFYKDTYFDTFESLYERADRGTYESKRHGGNHITFEDDPMYFD